MNKEDYWCAEDLMDHYLGILIARGQEEGNDIERDTLTLFCLVSMARSLDYLEHRLVQIKQELEKINGNPRKPSQPAECSR